VARGESQLADAAWGEKNRRGERGSN